jgi:hypothetical protein
MNCRLVPLAFSTRGFAAYSIIGMFYPPRFNSFTVFAAWFCRRSGHWFSRWLFPGYEQFLVGYHRVFA